MSDSEEEDEIYIQLEEQIKSFTKDEANSALTVKDRFDLGHEPACVFKKSGGKRVEFGHLQAGKTYTIESGEKIPNQKQHVQNAAMISMATYKENGQTRYLENSSTYHTLKTVCAISVNSPQGVILAVGDVQGENTLYVAYRGTATWEDALDDADIKLTENDSIPGGRFHSGFSRRSGTVSLEQILHCAHKEQCKRVVTCGHSLGGSVSSITAIKLMQHIGTESDISVHNITFGAPFFANEVVRLTCKEERLDRHMLHYVGHEDIVPGLLSLGHTAQMIERAINDATGGLLKDCQTFLPTAGKVASFVLGNIPWGNSDIKSEAEILCRLMANILDGPKTTALGQAHSPFEYVPIGNFYLIENHNVSLLASDSTTPQIQELVLKEPIRRINSPDAIKKGHSLGDYYCANLKVLNKVEAVERRELTETNHLCPHQEGQASIFLKRKDKDTHKCTIIVMGSFLQSSRVESKALTKTLGETMKFECRPSIIVISGIMSDLKEEALANLELQLSTPFGEIPIKMGVHKTSEMKNIPNILSEPVSAVIHKSFSRCLTLSALKDGEPAIESEKTVENSLRTKLESLVKLVEPDHSAEFQSLYSDPNPFKQKEKINSFVETILDGVIKDIQLYSNNIYTSFRKWADADKLYSVFKMENNLQFFTRALTSGFRFLLYSFNAGLLVLLIKEITTEKDYNKQLAQILKLIMNDKTLKLACKDDQEILELMAKTGDELTNNGEKAYAGERIIALLQNKTHIFSNPGLLFLDLVARSRHAVLSRMEIFQSVHNIRMLYSKQCFIGFVGPQNAGKSTLINSLFGRTAEVGMRNHTKEPTRYEVAENIFAIDFPGSDSLEDHSQRFKEFGSMNNLFIYVIPYNGTPSRSLVANVMSAYRIEMVSGKASKTIFCINKSAVGDEVFDNTYKKQFVEKIKDGIDYKEEDSAMIEILNVLKKDTKPKHNFADAFKEIEAMNKKLNAYALDAISEDDFLFTDWTTEASNRGIMGPNEVRRRIKKYLIDSQIRMPDEVIDF
eukprot:GFUD01008839.1.p1 GENE.GFUD01008839.1~~GFUD01008839.1.p1  ORF type:complete len:1020 (+),score=178.99 GFUD01008839.1:195-3254(+)